MYVAGQLEKEANDLKENLSALETKLAQLSANQQAATDSLEQMAKSADGSDRYSNKQLQLQSCFPALVILHCYSEWLNVRLNCIINNNK